MKKEKREECRKLRLDGLSVKKIAKMVGVSCSSVSAWVKDIVLSEEQLSKMSNIRHKEGKLFWDTPVQEIENLFRGGLNQKKMAEKFDVSVNLVNRYVRKHKLNSLTPRGNPKHQKKTSVLCILCGKEVSRIKGRICNTCVSRVRRILFKTRAIKYLGGKCVKCGWEPSSHEIFAIEFHHKDRQDKDFTIGTRTNQKWKSMSKELDKCELLCSRCHRIEHGKVDGLFEFAISKSATMTEW